MHSSLDWIYTVDIDAGTLTISSMSEWRGLLAPSPSLPLDLAEIYETYSIDGWTVRKPRYMFGEDIRESNEAQAKQFETFEMDLGIPSPMNELQGRFFTDLVFVWRFWIDDPSTWRYNSPVFRVLCAAFLRLAAWDFEVSFDSRCSEVELPIDATSIPLWSYPDTDIYWFHGYLVVLQESLQSDAMINKAISKAKSYIGTLDTRPRHGKTRLICISLRQVVFVELSQEAALASKSLVLLSSSSATQCSPGFRALARVLTSNCWKPHAYREKWPVNMPPEIIEMIFSKMEPGDAVAFSQAFSVAEQCYYASEFQFKNIDVQSFESSIPCCGKRTRLETHGICCSECYSWQHLECLGLENDSSSSKGRYVCLDCQEREMVLDPGGINRFSCRKVREGCQVRANGLLKSLQLRLSKPAHLRPELRSYARLDSVAPSLIDYTILFNHAFSGLAYGLEPLEDTSC
jgi:hypothetical protein